MNPLWDMIPACPNCKTPMKLNVAIKVENLRQYICTCRGVMTYTNIHKNQEPRKD